MLRRSIFGISICLLIAALTLWPGADFPLVGPRAAGGADRAAGGGVRAADKAKDKAAKEGSESTDGETRAKGEDAKGEPAKKEADAKSEEDTDDDLKPVYKTDREWKRVLSAKEYRVTRHKETELPFSGKYVHTKKEGTYRCVCCGAKLFGSDTKFDSGTGWPSFYAPLKKKAVGTAADYSDGTPRVEVTCARCDAHLGHVFGDGPAPTGLRYCINSVALKLEESPKQGATPVGTKQDGKKPIPDK